MNNIQKIDTTLSTLAKHTPVAGTFVPTLNTMKTGIDGNLQLVVPEIKIPKLNVILKGTLRQYQLLKLFCLQIMGELIAGWFRTPAVFSNI